MRRRRFHPAALGRAAGFSAVAIIVVVAAVHVRRHAAIIGSLPDAAASFADSGDALSRELTRCKAIGMSSQEYPSCVAAWAENRRQFFTYRSSTQPFTATAAAPISKSPR